MPKNTPSKNSVGNATKSHSEIQLKLISEVKTLNRQVANLKDLEFIQVFKHPVKFMWFSFLKGLMVGFGSVLGASVLVALFIYIMGQISLIPVIGDFVQDVVREVQQKP